MTTRTMSTRMYVLVQSIVPSSRHIYRSGHRSQGHANNFGRRRNCRVCLSTSVERMSLYLFHYRLFCENEREDTWIGCSCASYCGQTMGNTQETHRYSWQVLRLVLTIQCSTEFVFVC